MHAELSKRASPLRTVSVPGLLRQPAVWIAAFSLALYLPIALTVLELGPDPIDYIDIGRHLAAGDGYVLSVKSHHFGGTEVVRNGLEERAPLFPALIAILLRSGAGLFAIQLMNAVLAAGCAVLVSLIGTIVLGRQVGLLAGLLAGASPAVLIHMLLPMSEGLAIFLALLVAWLVMRSLDAPRSRDFAAAGVALGLAYLTRPITVVMMAALLLGLLVVSRVRRALFKPLLVLGLASAVFIAPITLYSLATRGSPSYLSDAWYSVFQDSDLIVDASLQPLPRPAEFILANREQVAAAVARTVQAYAGLLFLDGRWLLPLLPGLLVTLLELVRRRLPRPTLPILLLAGANFVAYGLTWSIFARRYQLLTLLLLLPFGIEGLRRLGLERWRLPRARGLNCLHLAVLAVGLSWSPTFVQQYGGSFQEAGGGDFVGVRTYGGLRWTGPPSWTEDRDLRPVLDWIRQNTEQGDILASRNPHILTFFTARPSTLLPRKLDTPTLRWLLVQYRVAYVLLNNQDGYRRRYQGDLDDLESLGVAGSAVGAYRIYDTRPLWR